MSYARELIEIATVDRRGRARIDYSIPREKGAMSTEIRPELFARSRSIPGTDKRIKMYFAYVRDGSGSDVVRSLKKVNTPSIEQFVNRTAIYLAAKLRGSEPAFDAVMPAPSSSPLAGKLAAALATRLSAPLLSAPTKQGSMCSVHVSQRHAKAKDCFNVPDQPRMNGSILVVDDVTTTGATFVGLAANLYQYPDVTNVTGAGMAVA